MTWRLKTKVPMTLRFESKKAKRLKIASKSCLASKNCTLHHAVIDQVDSPAASHKNSDFFMIFEFVIAAAT